MVSLYIIRLKNCQIRCVSCSPLSFQTYRIVDIRLKNSTIGEFNVSCQKHSLQVDLLFLYFQISMLRDVISNALLPLGVSYVNSSKIFFILLTKLHVNSSSFHKIACYGSTTINHRITKKNSYKHFKHMCFAFVGHLQKRFLINLAEKIPKTFSSTISDFS